MSLILVAVLVIGGLLGAAAGVIGIPVLIALVAYDLYAARGLHQVQTASPEHRIQVERGFARGFVVAGGAFWAIATFAGLYTFRDSGAAAAMLGAFIPLTATIATLVIGWYYERVMAALLTIATFAVVVWGVVANFELGVWIIVTFALIGPMMTAAVLFWMARRDQDALELSIATRTELSPVAATRGP